MLTGFILTAVVIFAIGFYFLLRPLLAANSSVLTAGVLFATVGAAAASLYLLVGTPAALNPQLALPAKNLDDAVAQLQARVASKPEDSQAWLLLAQAQLTRHDNAQVRQSLDNAVRHAPDDADILSQAAETLALTRDDHRIPDTAVQWLERAVKADGHHQRARWFLGIAQRQRGQDAAAAATWEPLLPIVDRAAGEALLLEVNDARKASGQAALTSDTLKALPPESVAVRLHLSPELKASLPVEAAIFITVKSKGQAMPLAAKRYTLDELPSTVYLSDADSPMPTAKLSQGKDLEVAAKVSMSGSATPAPDDVESASLPIRAGERVDLTLGAKAQ